MRRGRRQVVGLAVMLLAVAGAAGAGAAGADPAGAGEKTKAGKFVWSTDSAEAKTLLAEVQQRIESYQVGPPTVQRARKVVDADPRFAMGHYYVSAMVPGPDGQLELDKAVALAKRASDGERRFIVAMAAFRGIQTINDPAVAKTVAQLEELAKDYPEERLVQVILGQLYQATSEAEKARQAFLRCEEIGPSSPRARAFLANNDLLDGHYAKARATFQGVEATLPKGTVPFTIRYGIAFSHLYEGHPDAALESLNTFLEEYREAGLTQGFPEVFIWNSIARINLENGRLEEAMKAYEKGFESVPESNLPDDQKALWEGRLLHGRSRVLARMGRTDEAWAVAEKIKAMIEEGGEEAEQYWPQWHYLAGYLKLEAGDPEAAVVHLEKANPDDPFQTLLLARAYERAGRKVDARQAYERVVASENNGLERALAYPEAKKKLTS
jgi:tetratricopeptide (TPR) repeat protein